MTNDKIKSIRAREILDSRGNPTIEVELKTELGSFCASVPSGASKGKNEAIELRDGGERYSGKGVLKAVKNVNEIIAQELTGQSVSEQKKIDDMMIKLDGTENKSKLGANAILPVSMAVCRAGAAVKNISLYKHISEISNLKFQVPYFKMPSPCLNIVNGGAHSNNNLDIQEFMIIPQGNNFAENLQMSTEIYHCLESIFEKKFGVGAVSLGDEGGFSSIIFGAEDAIDLIMEAVNHKKYGEKIKLGLDCAATYFKKWNSDEYFLENRELSTESLLGFYQRLVDEYPIVFLEDPFAEKDFKGFKEIQQALGEKILIVGDDLICTNPKMIKKAKEEKLCNGMIVKMNQIGTISETLVSAALAKSFGWKIITSHRSGDTCDDFIADLAVGIGSDFIKSGAPVRGERVAKYNRLLKIEQELNLSL